jgi:cell division protein FtsL
VTAGEIGGGKMTEIYVIKQIDNSRLTKELDFNRTRECLHLILLGLFCLLLFLFVAMQHHKVIQRGYEIEAQKEELNQLEELNQQLKMESAHLKDPNRIIPIAKQLGLQEATFDQVMVWPAPFPMEPTTTMVARSEKLVINSDAMRLQSAQ